MRSRVKIKLKVWENGKKEIKQFMKSIGCNYFDFPKLLKDAGLSGKLDIVRHKSHTLSVYDENNYCTTITLIYTSPGYIQVESNGTAVRYRVVHHFPFRLRLKKA